MTLIVSLRTSDGIVIAGDSLSTMRGNMQMDLDIKHKCSSCGHEDKSKVKMPGPPVNLSTLSYAQKVFPFMDNFGVGTFGIGQLSGQTIHFAVRKLEKELKDSKTKVDTLAGAADTIGKMIFDLLKMQEPNWKKIPKDKGVVGFQIVGYHDGEPRTIGVSVGSKVRINTAKDLGMTPSGKTEIVDILGKFYQANNAESPALMAFSLQDAIDYAEFLINTTADHQKFSQTLATVGGDIDVALVTPFDGFRWIRQKPLTKITDPRRQWVTQPQN